MLAFRQVLDFIHWKRTMRMTQRRVVVNLGHCLIAAAWADGRLQQSELESLKDLIFRLPGLRPEDWEELERRADIPAGAQERERLTESLVRSIGDEEDRQLVLDSLDELLSADQGFGPAEHDALSEIRRAIDQQPAKLWEGLRVFFKNPLKRRIGASGRAFDPKSRIRDLNQAIFDEVGEHLHKNDGSWVFDETELKRLCLAGGLMAHIAQIDRQVDQGERDTMIAALRDGWKLDEATARAVTDVMIIRSEGALDLHRALREFFELTTESERASFLDILFAVAAGDGMVSLEEMEEIRLIAMGLKLSNVHFIAAKTRVPRQRRVR